MDDNAPTHKARLLTEWFDEYENVAQRMLWSSQSSDLYSIESVQSHTEAVLVACGHPIPY